jgi:hypothetical protein
MNKPTNMDGSDYDIRKWWEIELGEPLVRSRKSPLAKAIMRLQPRKVSQAGRKG